MANTYRLERIERLLRELEYEIVRGMMEREIDETVQFAFVVPISQTLKAGVVWCEFRTRPVLSYAINHQQVGRLRLVAGTDLDKQEERNA